MSCKTKSSKVAIELCRQRGALAFFLAFRGLGPAEVSKRLGWRADRLPRILSGLVELRHEDILAVLEEIGVSPQSFFAAMFDFADQGGEWIH